MHLRKWDAYRVYLLQAGGTSFLFSLIFTINLVYQAQVVGLTPFQLVMVGTTLEVTAFLFEIPTGIVADLYSRRLSVIIGFFLIGIGFMIEGAFPFFAAVLLNQIIWGIGVTFTSGALEAWIVDEVGEERMGKVFLRGSQAGQVGGILGIILSVVLGSINLALPVVLGGALFVALAVFLVAFMPETGFKRAEPGSRSSWQSMSRTVRESIRLVRLRPMLLTFLLVALVMGAYSEGFDRLWRVHLTDNIGLPVLGTLNPVVWFGIISVIGMLLSALMTEVIRRRVDMNNERIIKRALMVFYSLMVVALLVFALAGNFWLALAAVLVAGMMRSSAEPITSTWSNLYIDSDVRATMLSSFGQVNAVGQIAGGPVVGVIGGVFGLRAALSASALLLAPIVWLIGRARHNERPIEPEGAVVEVPVA
jgi:DHA3 family tetracycline resistance protein-like MFS transporter